MIELTDRGAEPVAALRFVHPDDAHVPGRVAGLGADLSGRLAVVHGDDAIRQSLLMLLSTIPGERVMRPDYGCPLHRLVFQPLDNTTAGMAIHYVERAVRRFEPRVDVLRVDAGPAPDAVGVLAIELRYRVRRSLAEHQLTVELDVADGGVR